MSHPLWLNYIQKVGVRHKYVFENVRQNDSIFYHRS